MPPTAPPDPDTLRALASSLRDAGFHGVAVRQDMYGACMLEGDVATADDEARVLRLAFGVGLEVVRNGLFRPRAEFAVVPTRVRAVYQAQPGDTFAGLAARFYGTAGYDWLVAAANPHLEEPVEGALIELPI